MIVASTKLEQYCDELIISLLRVRPTHCNNWDPRNCLLNGPLPLQLLDSKQDEQHNSLRDYQLNFNWDATTLASPSSLFTMLVQQYRILCIWNNVLTVHQPRTYQPWNRNPSGAFISSFLSQEPATKNQNWTRKEVKLQI